MTNKNLTEIVLILDQSSSMGILAEESRTGVNQFLAEQRTLDKPARVTLTTFNSTVSFDQDNIDLKHFEDLASFPTGGMTALYDAIGHTVNRVGARLATTPENDRPGQVIVVIVTDGHENASKEFRDNAKVQQLIKHQQEKYSWDFVFLGANIDVKEYAQNLNIPVGNAFAYTASAAGNNRMYKSVSRGMMNKRVDHNLTIASAGFAPDPDPIDVDLDVNVNVTTGTSGVNTSGSSVPAGGKGKVSNRTYK